MSKYTVLYREKVLKEANTLKGFCSLCHEIAILNYLILNNGHYDNNALLSAQERLSKLRHDHPSCDCCGLLFGEKHMGREDDGYCQFCASERSKGLIRKKRRGMFRVLREEE